MNSKNQALIFIFLIVLYILLTATKQNVIKKEVSPKYDICIISRFKNCNYLLPQWIQYHVFAGVDHFFLVDDCSTSNDRREAFLFDCIDKGFCTITNASTSDCANERLHFKGMFSKYGTACLWVSVIDPDEYIFPTQFNLDISLYFLRRMLQNTSEILFRMPWYVMTSNGYENRPRGLLIDNYISGEYTNHIKTMIKSNYVRE